MFPYTPKLNPIEMIWDKVREKGFRKEIFKCFEAVIDRLRLTVRGLAEDVQRVASIAHLNKMIKAAIPRAPCFGKISRSARVALLRCTALNKVKVF